MKEENKKQQEIISQLQSTAYNYGSDAEKQEFITQNQRLQEELENIRKEQEDLLVLLTDQDSKLREYKSRLKNLGENVI